MEERIKQLELIRHTKIRDNVAVKYKLESENLSKSWINANKERCPHDTIQALQSMTRMSKAVMRRKSSCTLVFV